MKYFSEKEHEALKYFSQSMNRCNFQNGIETKLPFDSDWLDKNKVNETKFYSIVKKAFKKLIDCEFQYLGLTTMNTETIAIQKEDCLHHLFLIIEKYNPDKNAFSFFNCCCKNFILQMHKRETIERQQDEKIGIDNGRITADLVLRSKGTNKNKISRSESIRRLKEIITDTSFETMSEEIDIPEEKKFDSLPVITKKIVRLCESNRIKKEDQRVFMLNVVAILNDKMNPVKNKKELVKRMHFLNIPSDNRHFNKMKSVLGNSIALR